MLQPFLWDRWSVPLTTQSTQKHCFLRLPFQLFDCGTGGCPGSQTNPVNLTACECHACLQLASHGVVDLALLASPASPDTTRVMSTACMLALWPGSTGMPRDSTVLNRRSGTCMTHDLGCSHVCLPVQIKWCWCHRVHRSTMRQGSSTRRHILPTTTSPWTQH